jgi:hypothetical protein
MSTLLKSAATGFAGGMLGALLVAASPAGAQLSALLGDHLSLRDAHGRRYIDAAKSAGGGHAIFFLDGQDRSRMEVGLYDDGLPMVVLESQQHTAKAILRLAGSNHSGVLVFKDKQNRDRMILGLDMNGLDEQPFLVTFDAQGRKKVVFGAY